MDKRPKYRKLIEDLKQLAQSQAEFKRKVQQARRGQVAAAEATTTALKPVTEALLGKQPETKPLSEEEVKQLQKKGLVGIVKEQQEAAAAKIVARSDEERRRLAEALTAYILNPDARQAEINRLINNPLEFERRLANFTVGPIRSKLEDITKKIEESGDVFQEILRKESYPRALSQFEKDLKNINNKIEDAEYKMFNLSYRFKDSRIYDIQRKEYNADEKIAQLKDNKKQIDLVVPENREYYEAIKKYREGIIADLYIKAINKIINEKKFGHHTNVLSTIANEIDLKRVPAASLVETERRKQTEEPLVIFPEQIEKPLVTSPEETERRRQIENNF